MPVSEWPISTRVKNKLIAAGIYNQIQLPEFLDELKKIKGLGPGGVTEVREWARDKWNLTFKTRKKVRKYLKDFGAAKRILEHLIEKPQGWGKQLRLAQMLLEKYGEETLLRVAPNPKVYSLNWFLGDWGDKYIRQYMSAVVVPVKKEEVVEEYIENEFDRVEKPKSLKDFLKL